MELDKVFTDKCSGKDTKRPELNNLIDYVRAVDTVHVHSIDRMARNVNDLISITNTLKDKGVSIKFHKEGLLFSADESNPMSDVFTFDEDGEKISLRYDLSLPLSRFYAQNYLNLPNPY